jgi:hypothetical protein
MRLAARFVMAGILLFGVTRFASSEDKSQKNCGSKLWVYDHGAPGSTPNQTSLEIDVVKETFDRQLKQYTKSPISNAVIIAGMQNETHNGGATNSSGLLKLKFIDAPDELVPFNIMVQTNQKNLSSIPQMKTVLAGNATNKLSVVLREKCAL